MKLLVGLKNKGSRFFCFAVGFDRAWWQFYPLHFCTAFADILNHRVSMFQLSGSIPASSLASNMVKSHRSFTSLAAVYEFWVTPFSEMFDWFNRFQCPSKVGAPSVCNPQVRRAAPVILSCRHWTVSLKKIWPKPSPSPSPSPSRVQHLAVSTIFPWHAAVLGFVSIQCHNVVRPFCWKRWT